MSVCSPVLNYRPVCGRGAWSETAGPRRGTAASERKNSQVQARRGSVSWSWAGHPSVADSAALIEPPDAAGKTNHEDRSAESTSVPGTTSSGG